MPNKPIPKNKIVRRLKIIEGHLKKVTQMVEDDKYCIDVLQQSAAVQSALKKVDQLLLDNHLHCCVTNAIKKNKSKKAIQELLEVFKKANK
jgi:DNA-binding FrmR family transcriptional regulator